MAARATPAMAVTAIATETLFQPDQKPTPRPVSTKVRRWERPPSATEEDEESMGRRRMSFAHDGSRPSAINNAINNDMGHREIILFFFFKKNFLI